MEKDADKISQSGVGSHEEARWRPRVSALVPAFNSASFITNALESLAAQTWPDLEVIVGDDCSSDETLQVVRNFAAGRENFAVVSRPHNIGWVRNSNDLMSRASGELIFFAFHDDMVAPRYVEKLVAALAVDPQAVVAFSDLCLIHTNGTREEVTYTDLDGVRSSLARGLAMAHRQGNWWAAIHGVFRRSAFDEAGGLATHDAGEKSADWPWMLQLALRGPFVRVPEVLCYKTYKPDSLSLSWERGAEYKEALRRAADAVVRASSLPCWQKEILRADLRRTWSLGPLRGFARRILGRY